MRESGTRGVGVRRPRWGACVFWPLVTEAGSLPSRPEGQNMVLSEPSLGPPDESHDNEGPIGGSWSFVDQFFPEKLPKADRDGEKYHGFSLSLVSISSIVFPIG